MKLKKILALALALCMVLAMLAACKDTAEPAAPSPKTSTSPSDAGGEVEEPEEIVEITYAGFFYNTYDTGPGTVVQMVEDAINEITEKEIGVHVNFTWTPMGDYATQLILNISNKEVIDVAHYWYRGNIATMYANSAAMDITDLLNEYAKETVELEGWILDMASFNGRVYGVPTYRQLNASTYAIFRSDILEKAGMLDKAPKITTWAELEEILAAITATGGTYGVGTAAHSGMILGPAVRLNGEKFSDTGLVEALSDSLSIIGADQEGNVFNLFKDDGSRDSMKMVADWYDKGYVWPDSAFSGEQVKTLLASGVFGTLIVGSEYGVEGNYRAATGTDVVCVKLYDNIMTGSAAAGLGCFVPVSASEEEAAVKFINLMYSSPEIMNLITWGIEGESYIVEDGIAKYPEGLDTTSCGYHLPDYMIGNQFLVLPWEGTPANFRELAHEDFLNATLSKYTGFNADISSIETLFTSLTAVRGEYFASLTCGMYTDSLYDEYVEKLDSVGAEDYVELFQTQLDAFMK